jgi:hypothetical protein
MPAILAEESAVFGFEGLPPNKTEWLSDDFILNLLSSSFPESNISDGERRETLAEFLEHWKEIEPAIKLLLDVRAQKLLQSHRRVRAAVSLARRGLSVTPHFPPDLIGVLVLLPVVRGVAS